jgi:hypothetical protein
MVSVKNVIRDVDESSDSEDDNEILLPRFKKKSSWIPKPSKNTTLESFIDLVKNDVQTATSTNIPTHNNLTPAEKGALQELKERDDIVIKSADKGSAIVVMDKVDYLEHRNKNGPRRKGVHGFHFLKIISGVFQM